MIMNRTIGFVRSLVLAVAGVTVAACGSLQNALPSAQPDYKTTIPLNVLEIPPDLTSSTIDDTLVVPELGPAGTATYSDYSGERAAGSIQDSASLLAQPDNARIRRDGQARWLEVDAQPEEVWKMLKRFWEDNGFALAVDDPRIGVMETEWAENRADIPAGPVRNLIGGALGFLYSSPTRDKFRIRIEQSLDSPSTEVYLTHYGVYEVQKGEYDVVWEDRPRDPELEAAMLSRLMVFMGISEERAETMLADRQGQVGERAEIRSAADGHPYLLVEDSLPRTWRLVGLALDGSNYVVEESDVTRGTYLVRYRDPAASQNSEGMFAGLAFWRDRSDTDPYEVRMTALDRLQTSVVIYDEDGDASQSETARNILTALLGQLK